jgi:ketosteroid isomerase-like protein
MLTAKHKLSVAGNRKRTPARCRVYVLGALTLVAFAMPLFGAGPRTQKHESRNEIFQLEDKWRNAVLKADAAVLDSLLADDYIGITAGGTLQSKEQALAVMRSGAFHVTELAVYDRRVRFYGRTAVVTSRAEIMGISATRDISGSFRYTRVYARNAQGEWKIVSFEASRIRERHEHK